MRRPRLTTAERRRVEYETELVLTGIADPLDEVMYRVRAVLRRLPARVRHEVTRELANVIGDRLFADAASDVVDIRVSVER